MDGEVIVTVVIYRTLYWYFALMIFVYDGHRYDDINDIIMILFM